MAILRAQISLKHVNGLAEDDLINVLHFSTADTTPGTLETIKTSCINIYNGQTGASPRLYTHFSNEMKDSGHEVTLYNMDDPKPRAPISASPFAFAGAPVGDPLPGEVACCLSFQALPASGTIQARRRGRIFIGRLGKDTAGGGRPTAALIGSMVQSGIRLLGDSSANVNWSWIVLSEAHTASAKDPRPSYGRTFNPVSNGWVDNAFDTQRRRGLAPTSRTVYA